MSQSRSPARVALQGHMVALCAAMIVLLWLLFGESITPWQYEPIVPSQLLLALIAIALAVLSVLAPTFRPISPAQRTILAALRLCVVIIVVLFMLRPTCITTDVSKQSASLLVLFDQSRSMTLPHQTENQSRWQAQVETLRANESILKEISEDLDVKLLAYDTVLVPIEMKDGRIVFPEAADGDATDIGTTLYDAIAAERSNRIAGVILLGDGVQTVTGEAPHVESWEAAEELVRLSQPLYTVAFGPVGDAQYARDVAVVNLPDQYSVFAKNELVVQAALRIRGFRGREIPVELAIEDAQGKREVVDIARVAAKNDNEQLDVQLRYTPPEAGQYRLTVRMESQEGETVVKNNELSSFLTVLGGGLRVLYLEGDLRLEQKFLRRSIDASQDVELDFQWIDHRLRDKWPLDLSETFKDPQYDVFILGDLDSSALYWPGEHEQCLKALSAAVESGKGLIMLGGFHSFGPGRYGMTPLADLLPIEIDRFEAQDFEKPIRDDLHIRGPVELVPVQNHFLTRLAADEDNQNAWNSLPTLDGMNRFHQVKDRSQVLLESDDGLPVLVSGEFGGRVLAFAGDSTWRWWMSGNEDKHRRFWRQIILWLARRDDLIQDNVWITLSQRRFDPGARIELVTGVKSSAGDPIRDADLKASIVRPDGQREAIQLTRTAPGQTGRYTKTEQPGTYAVEVVAARNGKQLGTAEAKFMVYDHDIELSIPEANHDQLARLAYQTSGRPVAPEELAELLNEIKQRPHELQIEIPKKWQLGDTSQDAWLFFLGLVALLSCEWVLRKRWGLV